MAVSIECHAGFDPETKRPIWKSEKIIQPGRIYAMENYEPFEQTEHLILVECTSDDKAARVGVTTFGNVYIKESHDGERDYAIINPDLVVVTSELSLGQTKLLDIMPSPESVPIPSRITLD